MIELNNYSFTYPATRENSLDGISLKIDEGECVLVCGQSGCGKSTLTRVLNGLCPKFYEGNASGEYRLCGKPIEEYSLDEIGGVIGSVFQDPRSQFFAKRVCDEIVLAMENHCFPRETMRERLEDISDLLGISALHSRDMSELSSGEKQKVAIASVCALEPKGLVLDEPSANLDTNSAVKLGDFLQRLKAQGHTLVISEHRLHYLKDIFDRMIILQNGKIIAELTRKQALALTADELKKYGLRSFELPKIELVRSASEKSDCLETEKISLRLSDTQILNNISIGLFNGKITAVTGSSGAGKTSICRIITGILKETTGSVRVNGRLTSRKARTKSTFFVQQDVDYQLYTPSVQEEILMASDYSRDDEFFTKTVVALGLDGILSRHPNTLSGGQKQRVLIAASILRNSEIIVLDEPTSGLDGKNMLVVSQVLKELAGMGKSVLLVTHDTEFIKLAADNLVYMHGGEIRYNRFTGN